MANIFTIDAAIKSIIQGALDDIITNLGKNCLLVYPPKMLPCDNCVSNPIGNLPSNRWRTGGPIHFGVGSLCPMCDGQGMRAEELTEAILLLCEWDPKKFIKPFQGLDIRIPNGLLQTKGYLVDMPKILRCDHLVFQTDVAGMSHFKYKLYDDPGDRSNIIQNRYFIATWERV